MAPYVEEPNEPSLEASTKRALNLVAPEPGTYGGELLSPTLAQ